MQAADALEDDEMASAVVAEVAKRFLAPRTSKKQGTKKRKKPEENESDVSVPFFSSDYSPADEVCRTQVQLCTFFQPCTDVKSVKLGC
jgi:hypothetical protein